MNELKPNEITLIVSSTSIQYVFKLILMPSQRNGRVMHRPPCNMNLRNKKHDSRPVCSQKWLQLKQLSIVEFKSQMNRLPRFNSKQKRERCKSGWMQKRWFVCNKLKWTKCAICKCCKTFRQVINLFTMQELHSPMHPSVGNKRFAMLNVKRSMKLLRFTNMHKRESKNWKITFKMQICRL